MKFDDLPDDTTRQPDADNSPPQPTLKFDDIPDAGARAPLKFDDIPDGNQPSAGAAPLKFDDIPEGGSGEEYSPLETTLQHAAARAPVGAAAGVGGLVGAEMGAAAGAPLGPVGAFIGGVGGGLIGALGTGWLASKPLDWVYDKLGMNAPLEESAAQNPKSADLGDFIGNALPAFGLGAGRMVGQRVLGAALGAGTEAGSELATEGKIDPTKVAMSAGVNAAFPQPRAWASRSAARITAPFKGAGTGAVENPVQTEPETPGRPDLKERTPDAPDADISKMEFETANDVTPVAAGTAADNHSAPEIASAGNPVGAPMEARTASPPSGATRDYRKGAQAGAGDVKTQDSTVMSTAPLHEDIAAALNGLPADLKPQLQNPEAPAQRPEPQPPIHTGIEQAARPPQTETVSGSTQNAPVTAAVTHNQQNMIDEIRADLSHPGVDPAALERFDALSPAEQVRAAVRGLNSKASVTGDSLGPSNAVRRPAERPTVGGAMARSKGDAERKQATLKSVTSVYDEFGPNSEKGKAIDPANMDKAQAITLAKEALAAATERNGGKDPLVRSSDNYVPMQKGPHTEAYQWLRAAKGLTRQFVSNKAVQDFAALHTSGEGGEGIGALDAETKGIEDSIQRRPAIPDAAAEANLHRAMEGQNTGREDFEPFQSKGEESPVYEGAQNSLRSWLNDLNDVDYRLLSNEHPDLKLNVEATNDPHELLMNLRDDLDAAQKKYPGVIESVPAEEVRAKPKAIRNAAELARFAETKPGAAASSGRALDKNSPEFKAAAEAALKAQPPVKSADRLTSEEAALRAEEPVPGTWDGLAKKFHDMLGDEEGSLHLPAWLRPAPSNPAVKAATEELNKTFKSNDGVLQRLKMRLMANFTASAKRTPGEQRTLYSKLENDKALTPDEQKYYDESVAPVKEMHDSLVRTWKRIDPEFPELFKGIDTRFVPRQVDRSMEPINDEPWKRTMSDFASPNEPRKWFALRNDGTGQRYIFDKNDDNTINVWKNQTLVKKNVPSTFEGNAGDTLTLKGSNQQFTVDHATTSEIAQHVKGAPSFVKDPLIAYSNAVLAMQSALVRRTMLEQIKADPTFQANSTTDKDVALANGWATEPTTLDELARTSGLNPKTIYMDNRLKWVLDDFAKPGINDNVLDKVRKFANNMAKPLYFLGPLFHPLNVADNWAHAMGQDLLKFRTYPKIAAEGRAAIQSVMTQDAIQQEINGAGGRTMLQSQLFDGGVIQQMMQQAGLQVQKRPSVLDPLARAMGVPIPELLHSAMKASNSMTWAANDMFYTALYMRNKRMGMNPQEAVEATERWIGAYRSESPTFGGSRLAQKLLNEPALGWFSAYHQDLWRSVGNIAKGLMAGATPQQTRESKGALAMSAILMLGVYPYILDKGVQALTGNSAAEFGRRGLSTLMDAGYKLVKGDQDYARLAAQVWTPSIPANMVLHGAGNKDWNGKDIIPPRPLSSPDNVVKSVARGANWALGQAVPPYQTADTALRQPGTSPGKVATKFLESSVGIKDPSQRAQKYEATLPKHQARDEKQLRKHPGTLEAIYNWTKQ